jgi:hypothetical protein
VGVSPIEQDGSNLTSDFGAPRLHSLHYLVSGLSHALSQQSQLRSLATAVDALESDEDSTIH